MIVQILYYVNSSSENSESRPISVGGVDDQAEVLYTGTSCIKQRFQIQTFVSQLEDTRTTNRKQTFLSYVVEVVHRKFPDLVDFSEELYLDGATSGNGFVFSKAVRNNSLRANSDQRQIYLCNINAFSVREVMTIKDIITQHELRCCIKKFSSCLL